MYDIHHNVFTMYIVQCTDKGVRLICDPNVDKDIIEYVTYVTLLHSD